MGGSFVALSLDRRHKNNVLTHSYIFTFNLQTQHHLQATRSLANLRKQAKTEDFSMTNKKAPHSKHCAGPLFFS